MRHLKRVVQGTVLPAFTMPIASVGCLFSISINVLWQYCFYKAKFSPCIGTDQSEKTNQWEIINKRYSKESTSTVAVKDWPGESDTCRADCQQSRLGRGAAKLLPSEGKPGPVFKTWQLMKLGTTLTIHDMFPAVT